ncbi:MAG: COX15/CtaA family protein [Halofilum sp. (in: g-proteobacteria)]|nr:COX15/CtaA family protein [Halofilum sp. (in: g-proteobacteria)]
MHRDPLIGRLAAIAAVLTLCVIVLGAWVRLSDAGLGCPDWPGCYGQLGVPADADEIEAANEAFPERPVDPAKAWKEMVHRYAAGGLGLLIAGIAAVAWRRRRRGTPVALPTALLALVVFQALLGMWTVTLLLKPLVVLAHLLGGMTLLAGLVWLALAHARSLPRLPHPRRLRPLTALALCVLVVQIALGGWTSSNYAAVACPDLPTCQGEWWPEMDFDAAFVPWHGLGIDYEGGILDGPARTAIHFSHRLGAVAATLAIGGLAAVCLRRRQHRNLRLAGAGLMVLLLLQLGLGLANVHWLLPLPVATAHNGGAALLLAALVALACLLRRSDPYA